MINRDLFRQCCVFVFSILCLYRYKFQVFAQQDPSISYITDNLNVRVSDTIDLQCSVYYASNYPILWVKINPEDEADNIIISHLSTLAVQDQRYSIRHEASSTYTLQIAKIQEADSGLYQCQVILSPSSKVVKNVWVHVKTPPVILDNSTISVTAAPGERKILECYAVGSPPPVVSWRRLNNDLLPTGGTVFRGNVLIIHNITKHDRGSYYCIADNGIGAGARRHVSVDVEFSPVVRIDQPVYKQALGFDMDLTCNCEAYPPPKIIWIKNHVQILNNPDKYNLAESRSGTVFVTSTLRVLQLENNDYGTYICQAYNNIGDNKQAVELQQVGYVVCPPACGIGLGGTASLLPSVIHVAALVLVVIFSYRQTCMVGSCCS